MGITAFLLIVAIQFAEGNAQQKRLVGMDCLHCKRVTEAHDCQTVKTCNVDEECFSEMYITGEGHIFLDLGCKTKVACHAINKYGRRSLSDPQRRQSDGRITLCEQCCNGSLCNNKACDTYNGTRRICYTCLGEHGVTDPSECETVTMCNAEEQCYNSHGLTNDFNLRNDLGCMSNQFCATISHEANDGSPRSSPNQNPPILIGRNVNQSGNLSRIGRQEQDFLQMCMYCCDRNYCNKPECQQGSTPVTQKSIATTTTIVSTTKTTTSTPTATLPTATLTTSVASTTPQPSIGMDCLHCKQVAEAHDCQTVKTCNVDEECFTEMYITGEGHIFLDLGCKSKMECDAINKFGRRSLSDPQRQQSDGRITLCEQCCNGSSCNSKACDTYNSTRRICYTCFGEHAVTYPRECKTATMCNAEEQCYNSHGLTNDFNLRNELGCMSNQICATISHEANDGSPRPSPNQNQPILIGRNVNQSGNPSRIGRQVQDFFQTCRYCCDRNYCNKPECQQVTQKAITTTTTMLSSSKTTTMMPTALSTSSTASPPSTMPIMSLATLTTSVASTTLQPSTICFVCGPHGCSNHSCTGATPYCLNFLDNNADGSKQETKRCGSELECERDWYNVTALSYICSVYEPWQLYASKFSCTYCCVRNYCNRDTNPPRDTLYYPKRQNS